MICFVEPQCIGWQHEMVNAGWVSLVQNKYPNENILYVSDKEHWENVRNAILEHGEEVFVEHIPIEINTVIKQNWVEENEFYAFIERLCEDYEGQITHLIMLSSHRANMRAIARIAKKYKEIRYIVVWHAIAEELFRTKTIKEKIAKRTLFTCLKKLLNRPNIRIISYGPLFKNKLEGLVAVNKLDNVFFMHHPYLFNNISNTCEERNVVNIGVIGAGVTDDALEIIRALEDEVDETQVVFSIIRSKKMLSNYKLVKVIGQGDAISRKQILQILSELDYMLLAYDKEKYMISASGVLFDAINSEIPLIALDSPLLEYYNQYDIGWVFHGKKELEAFLVKKLLAEKENNHSQRVNKIANIKALKKRCVEENQAVLVSVMD